MGKVQLEAEHTNLKLTEAIYWYYQWERTEHASPTSQLCLTSDTGHPITFKRQGIQRGAGPGRPASLQTSVCPLFLTSLPRVLPAPHHHLCPPCTPTSLLPSPPEHPPTSPNYRPRNNSHHKYNFAPEGPAETCTRLADHAQEQLSARLKALP